MVIKGVTFSLAGALDQQIDGRSDARFGSLRESSMAANVVANNPGQIWPIDDRMALNSTTPTSLDESQVAVTTAFFKMMR